jgi:hypothetical protein
MLSTAEPLPDVLQAGIRRVARDFGLAPDWMNTVVAKQWHGGMPPRTWSGTSSERFTSECPEGKP